MEYSPHSFEKKFSRFHGHCDTVNCLTCICGKRIAVVMEKHGVKAGDFFDEAGRPHTWEASQAELLEKINREIRDIPRSGEIVMPPDDAEEHIQITRIIPPQIRMGEDSEL